MSRPRTRDSLASARLPLFARLPLALGIIALLALAGCRTGESGPTQPAAPSESPAATSGNVTTAATPRIVDERVRNMQERMAGATASQATQAYTAKLEFQPPIAKVGESVEVRSSGYPAGAEVELVWYTVEGRYELEGNTEFVGQRVEQRAYVAATVRADASGAISTTLRVPQNFGGPHDVRRRVDGEEVSQASLTIMPTLTVSPSEGPIGTIIELRATGIDRRPNQNTWHVLWDKSYVGFVSAVTTKGTAVARFRAAGPLGEHRISVWRNSFYPTPYLNWQQGPYKAVASGIEFVFKVTSDPGPPPAVVEDFSATDHPWAANSRGPAKLVLSRDRGVVGQATTLRGSDLPPNAELTLRWQTMIGNRVSAIGFSEELKVLGKVRTGPDGTFVQDLTIPDDLGGQHRLEVVAGEKVLGTAGVVIQPSLVAVGPTSTCTRRSTKARIRSRVSIRCRSSPTPTIIHSVLRRPSAWRSRSWNRHRYH